MVPRLVAVRGVARGPRLAGGFVDTRMVEALGSACTGGRGDLVGWGSGDGGMGRTRVRCRFLFWELRRGCLLSRYGSQFFVSVVGVGGVVAPYIEWYLPIDGKESGSTARSTPGAIYASSPRYRKILK